jgi:tetratricopeptide (TPR) repeat protein
MRVVFIVLSLLFALAATAQPVRADDDYRDCYRATTADVVGDAEVAVCTRLIDSGRWKGLDSARLLSNRALGYIKRKELDLAMQDLDRALKISPAYAYGYDHRGEVWRMRGNYERAIIDYNHAIRVDPSFISAYLDRGAAYEAMGNFKSARADYQAVLDLPGKDRPVDKWAKEQARKRLDKLGPAN